MNNIVSSLPSDAYNNALKVLFGYNMKIAVSQAVNQFDDEDKFKKYLEENDIDIEKDLTEENITAILDKWPSFFDGMDIEVNEDKENIKKDYYIIL